MVSSAPLIEFDGPTLSIRGESVIELAPLGAEIMPENCPASSVCKEYMAPDRFSATEKSEEDGRFAS